MLMVALVVDLLHCGLDVKLSWQKDKSIFVVLIAAVFKALENLVQKDADRVRKLIRIAFCPERKVFDIHIIDSGFD